eukprot:TRINITY_DN27884_c0_g1_i1.p1 TRINITY_DN27884_c0_g1~~TRINITY_DN27884_c0_g1_i1.p1  ORF type:complete len:279 (-),score=75.45 TRINITY_DN27884_c0_g1_i1:171-1007(-)
MSTDAATGGSQLMASLVGEDGSHAGGSKMHADDAHFDMLDKLRSDDFGGLVKSANEAHAQKLEQQLCLGSDGSVTKANPLTAYRGLGAQRAAAAQAPGEPFQAPGPSEDDELKQLRAMRLAQMQQENTWRASGHGKLRELNNEADFIGVVQPRERAVVLLSDSIRDKEHPEMVEAMEQLCKKHVEAQFCHLEYTKAGLISALVDLEQGLPVVFVLKHGKVTSALQPSRLFEFSSASSPLFSKHLASMLRRIGGIGSGIATNSDSECDSEDERKQKRYR